MLLTGVLQQFLVTCFRWHANLTRVPFDCVQINRRSTYVCEFPYFVVINIPKSSACKILHRDSPAQRGTSCVFWAVPLNGPVGWELKIIPTASLQRGKISQNECPGYDTKQSDGEFPEILEIWRMWRIPLLPTLPDPLRQGVVAPDRVLSICQIELNCVLMLN